VKIVKYYQNFVASVSCLEPVVLLVIRLFIASIFFKAGLVKIEDFSNTIYLFREEYKVPLISPVFAAVSGTFFELCCPVLLTLGLATRLAVLPLLVMTAVINFTYDMNIQHTYWAMLLGVLLVEGAGKISLDYVIARKRRVK